MTKQQAREYARLIEVLGNHGIEADGVDALLRCGRTLQRWSESECGDSNDRGSWAIERDDAGRPEMVRHHYRYGNGQDVCTRTPIADREAGALKRATAIAQAHGLTIYHQTDPRGAALYVMRPGDVPQGERAESYYTRGICVAI